MAQVEAKRYNFQIIEKKQFFDAKIYYLAGVI